MTERVGLLGWPLGYSVSPAMHNAAFAALGLDWTYNALPVPPDQLAAEITRLVQEGYRGFNVTIPHKRAAFAHPLVRQISPAAQAIAATNTLIVQPDGTLHADNTDWQGFLDDLHAHNLSAQGKICLLLGAGGGAQAVAYALRQQGAADVIMVDIVDQPGVRPYRDLPNLAPVAQLVVNCTPLGMVSHVDQSPWPVEIPFPPGAALYDLVYNPPVTRLMASVRAAGQAAVTGLGMLVRQGALSFERWTGQAAPVEVMLEAAQVALFS